MRKVKRIRFGTLIREARQQQNLTLAQLSDATGVPESSLSEIENGLQVDIRLSTLQRIANGLGKTVAEVIGEKSP